MVHRARGQKKGVRWRFRSTLSRFAEWCIAHGVKKGKRRAAEAGFRVTELFLPPPFFFPLSRLAARTIPQANAVSERNLLLTRALDSPAAHTIPQANAVSERNLLLARALDSPAAHTIPQANAVSERNLLLARALDSPAAHTILHHEGHQAFIFIKDGLSANLLYYYPALRAPLLKKKGNFRDRTCRAEKRN
jgi:hypothetical protein